MTESELSDKLVALKKEQFNLRFQQATGQLEKTADVRRVRRDIARIKTVMNEKKSADTNTTSNKSNISTTKLVQNHSKYHLSYTNISTNHETFHPFFSLCLQL